MLCQGCWRYKRPSGQERINKDAEDLFSFAYNEPSSLYILRNIEAKINYELFNQKPFSELMAKPDLIPWNPESLSHALETFACTTVMVSDIFPWLINTSNSVNLDTEYHGLTPAGN